MITIIEPITGDLSRDNAMLAEYLHRHLPEGVEFCFRQIPSGFPAIESEYQGMVNGVQIARLYRKGFSEDCEGVVVDCFDDPGVSACREIGGVPVMGTYQAAIAAASVLSDRIGIITTDLPGVTNEERKARAFGMEQKIVSIRAIDTSVENILSDSSCILDALFETCRSMEREDRVTAVCLGCTGMHPVADELKRRLRAAGSHVSIIEPILNAVLMMDQLIRMECITDAPVEVRLDEEPDDSGFYES